ncbi:fam-a protein [Plasmodium vinckei lentum]|uniref:Fam-a protein n=1 Tax=Plasmodium vinckei lentum TaxID=138297 RepID=A0A6V7SLZ7_PLAVN|nr:fam-a protein [Plasmodium vinckei lentum]
MNKFYIQIALFLLSVSVYLNNKTLAAEAAPGKATTSNSKNRYSTAEEIYEQNKDLLCANPEEANEAIKLMSKAVIHLAYYATNKEGYKLCESDGSNNTRYYKKKHNENTNVEKFTYQKGDPNKYNHEVGKLWDPNILNSLDYKSTKRKVVRVYNPNLIIIQQRYKTTFFGRQEYFYALVKKSQISEDKTIIAMTSPNINDHNPSAKEYKNTIIESANLFKIDIDSEDDIKKGKLNKIFLNIGGYLIEKKDKCVHITYIESIDGHSSI